MFNEPSQPSDAGRLSNQMKSSRIIIERPVGNLRWCGMLATLALAGFAWPMLTSSTDAQWAGYLLSACCVFRMIYRIAVRPASRIIVEPDTISWFGDPDSWSGSNVVSFIAISSIEWRKNENGQLIILRNRFAKPWVIPESCFSDGGAVISAIRRLRPSLQVSENVSP
jgi:hypothetical protein